MLLRPGERPPVVPTAAERLVGDPTAPGPWQEEVARCDGAVNMAGEPVFGRWDAAKKARIRESRVATTRNLVAAIPAGGGFRLFSTSAVGIYGDAGDRVLDENAPLGTDFLARVAREWEAEALRARDRGARVVIGRFGIVLGRDGGALGQMAKMTRRFLGGPVGAGRQWFSWIHREDLVRAVEFLLARDDLEGVFNLCAPSPVRQIDLARALGRLLGRPSFTPAPKFAVRLALGEFADVVLFSQRMVPARLLEAGFTFRYPDLEGALRDIFSSEREDQIP
ncbi:MAG: TIGR01777 family oxidoreductase [Deferrisomatales bacterium]